MDHPVASAQNSSPKTGPKSAGPSIDPRYPENPVLVQVWRGAAVESQHRGAWVVSDSSGTTIDGVGSWRVPIFTRSSVKSLQALPLIETGAAQRFGLSDIEVALALSSHNAEKCHTEPVAALLARLGLSATDLQCGPQQPGDPDTRNKLRDDKQKPSALHNNCSGKHAGFLALALHLGVPTHDYLARESAGQRLIQKAVVDMSGMREADLYVAIDGCSAPTFRMPLSALATAFARVANPDGLPPLRRAACERMTAAVAEYPHLIVGHHQRICTDIARVTKGRLFPKIGGEAVYAIGVRGADRGLAIKVDDGSYRGFHALIVDLLRRFEFATKEECAALEAWEEKRITNWAGIEVGRTQVVA
ncbi:MAG: asparaginase [Planctomycetota bacterium]|nr:asparaginase [Planctomycetota bacterium]